MLQNLQIGLEKIVEESMVSNHGSADENEYKINKKKFNSERGFQRKNLFKSVQSPANTHIKFE